jgi:hypothetical protein
VCPFETRQRKFKRSLANGLSFATGVTDNDQPGTNDFFSIQLSNVYSDSRYLLDADIAMHYNKPGSVEKANLLFCQSGKPTF